jgi:curved DNA-binding protein CbpA
LSRADLVELLLELHRTRRSGIVRFERGKAKKQLVLEQGNLSFAESNAPDEHLAHVLIRLGFLSRADLKKVAALMKGGLRADEAAARAAGLNDEQLASGLGDQAVMILASLFSWQGCEPRVFSAEVLPQRRCRLDLPLPRALVDAARRAAGAQSPSPCCVPGPEALHADSNLGARSLLPLNAAEAYAYAQILKEPAPASSLARTLPPGDCKPEELIRRLLLLGLLRGHSGAASSARATEESRIGEQVREMLQRFEVANHYEVLAVPSDAQEIEIKSAYYEMARRYHPDRFASSRDSELRAQVEQLFTYITAAYAALGDAGARASYDEQRLKKESLVESTLQGRAVVDADREKMADALYRSGRAALKNGDFNKAVSRLRECVWLRADVARFQHWLAVAQSEIPALRKEAEQHFLKAIALDTVNADSYVRLGKLYLKVNLPIKAEAQFLEALRWDPENREASRLLGGHG